MKIVYHENSHGHHVMLMVKSAIAVPTSFSGLFPILFMIVLGTKIIIRLIHGTSLNPIIHFISKFGDHNHLLLQSEQHQTIKCKVVSLHEYTSKYLDLDLRERSSITSSGFAKFWTPPPPQIIEIIEGLDPPPKLMM